MSTTILSNAYQGSINEKRLKGTGALTYDKNRKEVTAQIDFSGSNFENIEAISKAGNGGFWSICCCNGCEINNSGSIIEISKGDFTTEREVEVWDDEQMVGHLIINGYARKAADKRFALQTEISGFYEGPQKLKAINGYEIVLEPEGKNKLFGSFINELEGEDGKIYTIKNFHKYLFHNGVSIELPTMKHILEIDVDQTFFSNEEQFFYLKASSKIEKL